MIEDLKEAKGRCLADLRGALPRYRGRLEAIDGRLTAYVDDALADGASHANLYELLGVRKVLRLMDTYAVDAERVRMAVRAIEGLWEEGRHVRGGLKFDTPRGDMHVRLMPYQVWCLLGIYAFRTEVDMERAYDGGELLPTEFVREGRVYDRRRLTQEAHLFQTRKSGKTEFGAAIDFVEVCFLGDVNGQALICSNSREQARICFKAIKGFATQIDPTCQNRLGGKYFRLTADEMSWQPGHRRKGEIKVMSAGGKTKDGLYASLVHADEHGSAGYTGGNSEMQNLVEVCWGSTGPRREKLLLHTSTAGLVNEGPYRTQVETVEGLLLGELEIALDGVPHPTEHDRWFAFLLRLDPWETGYSLEELDDPALFLKVNRSIGTTVQPTYYRERLQAARLSEDTKKEVLTKDFNVWQVGRVKKWVLTGEKVRALQCGLRARECRYDDGWQTYVGLDFGGTDDLFAMSTLSVNVRQGSQYFGRFFADTQAWITEAALEASPNRALFERWQEQGWLSVCEGDVFAPELAIAELMELHGAGVNMVSFGFDPAQSRQPVNSLKAWLQTLGIDARNIGRMVVPVSQKYVTMTPLIAELEYLALSSQPWLSFSASPLWPWCFGNAVLETIADDTLRLVHKSSLNAKIDPVHGLLDALYVFDLSEGRVESV